MAQVIGPATSATAQIIVQTSSSLTICATLALLGTLALRPNYRTPGWHLIAAMSTCDLISGITYVFGNRLVRGAPAACAVQALGHHWGDLGGIFASSCMATNLLLTIFRDYRDEQRRYLERYYMLIFVAFSIVPISICAMVLPDFLGDADLWCWIMPFYKELRIILFFVPLWLCFVYNAITYAIIGWKLTSVQRQLTSFSRKGAENASSVRMDRVRLRYMQTTSLFLLAMMISWLPATTNRLQQFITPGRTFPAVFLIHSCMTPGHGWVNALVFALTTKLRVHDNEKRSTGTGTGAATGTSTNTGTISANVTMSGKPGPTPASDNKSVRSSVDH